MDILTGSEMRDADTRTIEAVGVPSRVLMENAGRAVAGAMEQHIDDLQGRPIVILCGKGGNGGDGLVLLRTLSNLGYDASAIVLAPIEELAPDALDNLQSVLKLALAIEWVSNEAEWRDRFESFSNRAVYVDAMLGTGLRSAVRGLPERVIEDLETLDAYKVAIDLPSGLSSDSGALIGPCLSANLTVALAAPKACHFVSPASDHCGIVEVAEIGIPPRLLQSTSPRLYSADPSDFAGAWPERTAGAHKGDFGHLLLIGGSVGKTGAAVLAAEAALRAGVGLVTVASGGSALPMMASHLPEAMWEPLDETGSGGIAESALERVLGLASDRTAVACGPGLGRDEETMRLVRELARRCRAPMVLDADALFALSGEDPFELASSEAALTPHPGEAGRLLRQSSADVQADRLTAVRELAATYRAHVVLKGHRSLVSDTSGDTSVNVTGGPGLAKAGSGDVLTGIVGALLAQRRNAGEALRLGACVHGLAGDLASTALGAASVLARDVVSSLPEAIRSLSDDR